MKKECRERRLRLNAEVREMMNSEASKKSTCCEERKKRAIACNSCPSKNAAGLCTEKDKFTSYMVIMPSQKCPLDRW